MYEVQNGAAVDGGRVNVPAPLQNADANGPKKMEKRSLNKVNRIQN